MQKAIEYEIERQIEAHESGEGVSQETRLWDDKINKTRDAFQRRRARLPIFSRTRFATFIVTKEFIEKIKSEMPELPDAMRDRFINEYGLSFADASQLVLEKELTEYYEATARASNNPRVSANFILSELIRELNNAGKTASESPVSAENLAELIKI